MAQQKKRIVIVGGGASGMAAAYALAEHPDLFDVILYERSSSPGGMATSAPIDRNKYGADYVNDGVQGASPVFYNTYAIFDRLGFETTKVGFQASFGRDEETEFWSNVFPSHVIDKYQEDIEKFGKVLKIIKAFEPIFAVISVRAMLKLFRFSEDFGDVIVFPLVALFFGTGNQTPYISSAILERVFIDANMRLFEYSSKSFLASIPEMRAFPHLSTLYEQWKSHIERNGNVRVITCREVLRVKRSRHGVELWSRKTKGINNNQESITHPGAEEIQETFDELILAIDANAALNILGKDASWLEKKVLGNVKYLWDITVTHSDLDYMRKYYRTEYSSSLASQERSDDEEAQKQFKFAQANFEPLYYIRSYPSDKSKIEMSFDLTCYQGQFKGVSEDGKTQDERNSSSPPLERHVFQTIFLDKDGSSDLWSKGDIESDKVIMEKWWKQQSHRWQHYAGTVPWMMWLNGKRHTYFAGAWTVLNMHEIAVVSGFSAAYRLGAKYPFNDSEECRRLFALYLGLSHGSRMRKQDRTGFMM